MKKQGSGIAGAARINNLDRAGLARAEKHGKRLDQTGQSRAVNNVPPVTTTGLDLQKLFARHVKGAFVPKAKSSLMHILIQFPTDLVDGEDPGYMLHHARAFAERVFGDEAIFADRLDRDEKSRCVVDLFLAPRYMKTTKHESKPAVSTTNHLKALAKKHGEKPLPFGYGRALQTAFFEYMRAEMKLDGVERGKAKAVPGQDWKSAEQQRAEELDQLAAQVNAEREQVDHDRAAAGIDRETAAAARVAADAELLKLQREREALARRSTEVARLQRELQEAEAAIAVARAEVQRQHEELEVAFAMTARATAEAHNEVIAAAKARAAAEADQIGAARLGAQNSAERDAITVERSRREAELALLMRASDDANGLHLRPVGTGLVMNEDAMSDAERMTFHRAWPAPVRLLAFKLAKALEQIRDLTRRFRDREDRLKADEAALKRQEQANARELEGRRAAQQAEHEHALAALTVRKYEVTASAADAERQIAAANARMKAAMEKEGSATAAVALQEYWAKAVDIVGRYPAILIHKDDGSFHLNRAERTGRLPDWLVATLRQPAPSWAAATIRRLHQLNVATERTEARERDAAHHLEQLQDMIATAGPALQPAQQAVMEQASAMTRQVSAALRHHVQGQGI